MHHYRGMAKVKRRIEAQLESDAVLAPLASVVGKVTTAAVFEEKKKSYFFVSCSAKPGTVCAELP